VPKELQARGFALLFGDLFATLLIPYLAIALIVAAGYELSQPRAYATITALAAAWLTTLYFGDLYEVEKPWRKPQIAWRLLSAAGVASILFAIVTSLTHAFDFRSLFVLGYAFSASVPLLVWRLVVATPRHQQGVMVVGTGECAVEVARIIKTHEHLGYNFLGFVENGDSYSRRHGGPDAPVIGVSSLNCFPIRKAITLVVMSCTASKVLTPKQVLRLRLDGTRVIDCNTFHESLTGRLPVVLMQEEWLAFAPGFERSSTALKIKRVFDIFGAATILLASAPICLLAAIAIKLESPGPIFYSQERSGMRNCAFEIFKFRSMRRDAEAKSGATWAQVNDPRITRVGGIIRRFRIDELPQLLNVLKGDMSLVGPRPERPEMTEMLSKVVPLYEMRLSVKPGLTGWAQICYPYGASVEDAREKLCYDLFYIKNWSVGLDIQILLQSLKVVLFGRGAR
jgi:sugar transferase (PEP-CTERM system associated)